MPLLWAPPLGLLSGSFRHRFAHRRGGANFLTPRASGHPRRRWAGFSTGTQIHSSRATLGLFLLFVVAVGCIPSCSGLRPEVGHLTRFYLAMSFWRQLGGCSAHIVAPLLFDWAYEHPLLVIAAALLVPQYVLAPGRYAGAAFLTSQCRHWR